MAKLPPPCLAICPGEPAGIGPDITVQIAQKKQRQPLVAFADPQLLEQRAKQLKLPLVLEQWDPCSLPTEHQAGYLLIHPIPMQVAAKSGVPDNRNIPYVLNCLEAAADACLEGRCQGLVTGPVNKGLFHKAGIPFSGHTEFLAEKTQSPSVVMMLATETLRVALVTTHLPLRQVADAITPELLEEVISQTSRSLKQALGREPELYVLGLNPHCGDGGALGTEEKDFICPTLEKMQSQGYRITGPLSADTAFSPENIEAADAFIAMYHDQGLPVLKHTGFSNAVNITLGLNIIRTSVDHGTAYLLAGTGRSNPQSMQLAIDTAINLSGSSKSDL